MLSHPIEILPHVQDTLEALKDKYTLILITKGDLLDQARKIAQSGLRDMFDAVEIVSHKTATEYTDIFARHGDGAQRGLMAGNSMASDVIPMIKAGGWGVFVPHGLTWAVEHHEPPLDHPRFAEVAELNALIPLIAAIQGEKSPH